MRPKICMYILIICLVISASGCNDVKKLNANDYVNYTCYDSKLTCLDVEGGVTVKLRVGDEGSEGDVKVKYQLIPGTSDNQFICVKKFAPLFGLSQYYIFQNPDNRIDVWNDWTVEKIQLFYLSLHYPSKQKEPAKNPDKIIASTADVNCLSDIQYFNTNDLPQDDNNNLSDEYVMELYDEYALYVRVYFNESENIVWESNCLSRYSEALQHRVIYIQKTKGSFDFFGVNFGYFPISNNSNLYTWLSDAIESLHQNSSS